VSKNSNYFNISAFVAFMIWKKIYVELHGNLTDGLVTDDNHGRTDGNEGTLSKSTLGSTVILF
jgi:hypothetical protein